jgi:uncharacterized protein (TIGR02466 family)
MKLYKNFIYKIILNISAKIYNQFQFFFHTKLLSFLKDSHIKKYYKGKLYSKALKNKKITDNIFPPKIFILRNVKLQKNIIEEILNFKKKNNFNTLSNNKIYQSNHNLQENKKFTTSKRKLEKLLNDNLTKFYKNKNTLIKIKKMWFVISKNKGNIRPHYHPNGHLSGVYYPKNMDNRNFNSLNIFSPLKKLLIINLNNKKIKKNVITSRKYVFKPKQNDLIFFDSYLFHSVSVINSSNKNRISFAWDAKFIN